MPKKLPHSFSKHFWDVDFKSLDPSKYKDFVIKRILDRGDTKSVKWILNNYSKEKIKDVIMKTRDISRKTANFWAEMYQLDKQKIACLQKPYNPIPFGLSS